MYLKSGEAAALPFRPHMLPTNSITTAQSHTSSYIHSYSDGYGIARLSYSYSTNASINRYHETCYFHKSYSYECS